ncbi:MAG: YARHG domain-containing protein [Eubacteriales bacterium]|nr:YARHG domain-containing protein [Eubacteriales bacterium]
MKRNKRKTAIGICSLILLGANVNAQENADVSENEWIVSTEEQTLDLSDEVKTAFGEVMEEKIKEFGICDAKEMQEEKTGLYSPGDTQTGVCYTIFLDMEKDEIPEFYLLSYEQEKDGKQSLNEEIYRWDGAEADLVFEEKHIAQTGKEMVTEIYHESGPIGRYQQSVTDNSQEEGFLGTLYRMSQGEVQTYLSVEAKNGENGIREWNLEYEDETSSYGEIPDLQMKLRGLVGGNMRSKLIAGAQDERMIYDSSCTPVIYEKNEIYAAYNDISKMQEILNIGEEKITPVETEKQETEKEIKSETEKQESEKETESETEKQESEAETERTVMAAGHTVEPEIAQTENEIPETQPESTGMEEMKYYLYIQSQLVPTMGLMTSAEMTVNDAGNIISGSAAGVMSAVFSDVNEDGQKEMVLTYLKNNGTDSVNQIIFELYGIQNGQVVKYDDTLDYPSDKQNRLGIWENTEAYIKRKYLCVYHISASASLSSRISDLYIYELNQNQITMIRDYQFTRVPGTAAMTEGVQQISYYSGNETEISEEEIAQAEKKVKEELDYFGLSDLKMFVEDPVQNLDKEPIVSGIRMWKSKGIDTENMMNHTIWFTDDSGLTEYISPMQAPTAPQTETADPASYYILPGSDSHYLSDEEINSLPTNLLEYACNEIYARHGRKFADSAFQDYFNSKPWYHGIIEPDQFNTNVFNSYETENIMRLVERMQEVGIR